MLGRMVGGLWDSCCPKRYQSHLSQVSGPGIEPMTSVQQPEHFTFRFFDTQDTYSTSNKSRLQDFPMFRCYSPKHLKVLRRQTQKAQRMQAPTITAITIKKMATPLKLEYAWNIKIITLIGDFSVRLLTMQDIWSSSYMNPWMQSQLPTMLAASPLNQSLATLQSIL